MRPSSLGGGRILRRTLSVRLSVCLSVRPVIVAIGNVFSSTASSRMYFSARTEGRMSYGHLGRTNSCFYLIFSWEINMMMMMMMMMMMKIQNTNIGKNDLRKNDVWTTVMKQTRPIPAVIYSWALLIVNVQLLYTVRDTALCAAILRVLQIQMRKCIMWYPLSLSLSLSLSLVVGKTRNRKFLFGSIGCIPFIR